MKTELQSDLRAIEDIDDKSVQKKEAEGQNSIKAKAAAKQLAGETKSGRRGGTFCCRKTAEARMNAKRLPLRVELKAAEAGEEITETFSRKAGAARNYYPEASSPMISLRVRELFEPSQEETEEAAKLRQLGMVEDELAKREVQEAARKNKAIRDAKEAEELAAKKVAETEAKLKREAEEEEEEAKRVAELKKLEEAKKAKETLMRLKEEAEELKACGSEKVTRRSLGESASGEGRAAAEAEAAQVEAEAKASRSRSRSASRSGKGND